MKKNNSKWFILLLQGILSIGLIVQLFILDMFPFLYIFLLADLLAILWVIACKRIFKKSKKNPKKTPKHVVARFLSIILSVALLIANIYVFKGHSTLNKVTGGSTQIHQVAVYVLKGTMIEDLEDLKDKTLGYNSTVDQVNCTSALEDINKQVTGYNIDKYTSFESLVEAFYDGRIDAILASTSYAAAFEEVKLTYATDTKIIYTYEIEEEVESVVKGVDVTKDAFNIYISGIDTYGKVSTVSRSDVNMILTINPKTHQILMTSIPRDSYVTLASVGEKDKLSHSGNLGVNETINTLEQWLDIDINYYARVNFSSVVDIVDAIGGITVNSAESFKAYYEDVWFTKGLNNLNGAQTLTFVRERYNVTGGDFGRGQNQMRAIEGIVNKLISPVIITNYTQILDSVSGSFETSMSSKEITSIIKSQLKDMKGWEFYSQQITGTTSTGVYPSYMMPGASVSFVHPDEESVEKVVRNIEALLEGNTPEV